MKNNYTTAAPDTIKLIDLCERLSDNFSRGVENPRQTAALDLLQVAINELLELEGFAPILWGEGASERKDLLKHISA